eukprot:2418511-Karenia_brevis.AAC.1
MVVSAATPAMSTHLEGAEETNGFSGRASARQLSPCTKTALKVSAPATHPSKRHKSPPMHDDTRMAGPAYVSHQGSLSPTAPRVLMWDHRECILGRDTFMYRFVPACVAPPVLACVAPPAPGCYSLSVCGHLQAACPQD